MSSILKQAYMQAFDTTLLNNFWSVATSGADSFTVQTSPLTTVTGTTTVYRSSDGVTVDALEIATTITAAGFKPQMDCSGFPYLVFKITAVGTTYINFHVNLMRNTTT